MPAPADPPSPTGQPSPADPPSPHAPSAPHAVSSSRSVDIQAGLRTAFPACMAYLPLGFALGVLVVQKGLAWWWAPVFGSFIFAGSLEFLLVGLIVTVAPLTQIALSALLVNFRHVFYALSFPLGNVRGRAARTYSMFALTDEAYALAASGDSWRWSGTRILTTQIALQASWVAGTAMGGLAGQLIPPAVKGLDFTVTALFVVLAMDAYKVRRSIPVTVVALICSLVAALLTPHEFLVTAMGLFAVALAVSFAISRRRTRPHPSPSPHPGPHPSPRPRPDDGSTTA